MISRRTFLQSSTVSALADRLFARPAGATRPNADLENLGAVALREAKRLKATYCDIRLTRYRRQLIAVRLNPDFPFTSVSDAV